MTQQNLHVLILEDDPFDAELNIQQLKSIDGYNCIIHLATDEQSYLNMLDNGVPDLILSDFNLPAYDGLKALEHLKQRNPLIPFIFVTGATSEETAAHAIKAGAWDFVVKDRLFRLPLAIKSVLKIKQEKELAAIAEAKTNRLLMAIEQTSAQIIVADKFGKIEYVNKRFAEITGFELNDVLGKEAVSMSVGEFNHKVDKIISTLEGGNVFRGEVLSNTKNGEALWELLSITPIKNENNQITNYVTVKEDITLRKQMEQEVIKARDEAQRSNKLKESFLQNMSHEVRTPLNAIVGFSDLLSKAKNISDDTLGQYTHIIVSSSKQLLSIVTDILTISTIETGQVKLNVSKVNINAVFNELIRVFDPIAQNKNIKFICNIPLECENFFMQVDESKLIQVLTNLLDNAFKFTHEGAVELRFSLTNNKVKFSVKDTGIGIDEKYHMSIFERFIQADQIDHALYGGNGLGLSIAQAYVGMMGGAIKVDSKLNSGSVFSFQLPIIDSSKSHYVVKEFPKLENDQLHILVAEDEIFNYLLIEQSLSDYENIKLYHAEDGEQALEIFYTNTQINAVLLDIKMPKLNGEEVLIAIRKKNEHIPVIAQTAYSSDEDKGRLINLGFTDCFIKPLDIELLIKKLSNLIKTSI